MSCDISTRKLDVLVDGCEVWGETACAIASEDMGLTNGYIRLPNRQTKSTRAAV
jgi:hypothetical protein